MIQNPSHEQHQDELFDDTLKHARARRTRDRTAALTCNEASVDQILSEGEST